jgi:dihydroflavonol-4-reductase
LPKTLVTGGNGFIGSAVTRLLAERGDELRLLVRRRSRLGQLSDVEFDQAVGDVRDRRAVRRAMKGVDRVFHLAGVVSLRDTDADLMFDVNVDGARTVMEEALRAGVDRVVHVSSVASIGPAPWGQTADERQLFTAAHLGIPYVNSKHEGEAEAMRLAARGLPVVVVNPAYVFGVGDVYGRATAIVRRFMLGRIPAYVPGGLNVVDVQDVARGVLLADERGEVGERYILGNRNYTLDRLFADLSRLSGVEPPAMRLSAPMALRLTRAAEAAGIWTGFTSTDAKLASQWWCYRNGKAKRELGWTTAPHEDTIESTVAWYQDREADRLARAPRSQPVPLKVAAGVLGAFDGAAGAARRMWPLGTS